MIWKQCSRCGKRIPSGTTCECMKEMERARARRYDREKRDRKSAAFYASKPWERMQKACKDFFCGLDVYELYRNHRIVYGRITHHIIPIREDWERRFDVDNLIYLSDQSHHEVHARMDAGDRAVIEELREYRKRWIEAQGVSKKF